MALMLVNFNRTIFAEEGKLMVPQILALNNCCITDAGDNTELKDLCSTVYELDLAENTIQEWSEVSCCPGLNFSRYLTCIIAE